MINRFIIVSLGFFLTLPAGAANLHNSNRLAIYTAVNYVAVKSVLPKASPKPISNGATVGRSAAAATGMQPAVSGMQPAIYNPSAVLASNYANAYSVPSYAPVYTGYSPTPTPSYAPYYPMPSAPASYGAPAASAKQPWYKNPALLTGLAATSSSMLGGGGSSCSGGSYQPQTSACQAPQRDPSLAQKLASSPVPPFCNIPDHPQKVVFGFSGLFSDYIFEPVIRSMVGNTSQVDFHYYPWWQVNDSSVTDALTCAYKAATKKYYGPNGSVVYNSLTIVGHSFGGESARDLADMLGKAGVTVDMMVTADAREPATTLADNQPNWKRPCNVERYQNYWEPNGLLRGFAIPGANNIEICGEDHLDIPSDRLLVSNTQTAMNQMPACKQSYQGSAISSTPCNSATARVPASTVATDAPTGTVD